jgi:hypothetical protein
MKQLKKASNLLPKQKKALKFGLVPSLLLALLIDFIGMSTYALPIIGEAFDAIWAPVSAYLIYWLFGSSIFAVLGGVEEILPMTDIIPTATMAFLAQAFFNRR